MAEELYWLVASWGRLFDLSGVFGTLVGFAVVKEGRVLSLDDIGREWVLP
jgi:hypothetical protein